MRRFCSLAGRKKMTGKKNRLVDWAQGRLSTGVLKSLIRPLLLSKPTHATMSVITYTVRLIYLVSVA
jgi:hypothetical protein